MKRNNELGSNKEPKFDRERYYQKLTKGSNYEKELNSFGGLVFPRYVVRKNKNQINIFAPELTAELTLDKFEVLGANGREITIKYPNMNPNIVILIGVYQIMRFEPEYKKFKKVLLQIYDDYQHIKEKRAINKIKERFMGY